MNAAITGDNVNIVLGVSALNCSITIVSLRDSLTSYLHENTDANANTSSVNLVFILFISKKLIAFYDLEVDLLQKHSGRFVCQKYFPKAYLLQE